MTASLIQAVNEGYLNVNNLYDDWRKFKVFQFHFMSIGIINLLKV